MGFLYPRSPKLSFPRGRANLVPPTPIHPGPLPYRPNVGIKCLRLLFSLSRVLAESGFL